jgi:predicted transcriptional regulator
MKQPSPPEQCCPPEVVTEAEALDRPDESLARLAKALAHPARVHILRFLIGREACVCGEIVAQLPLAQSTVSQHLKILREAGLIKGEVDGPRTCYCVDPSRIQALKQLVGGL